MTDQPEKLDLTSQDIAEDNAEMYFGTNGKGVPQKKTYLSEVRGLVPVTIWPHEEVGQNHEANNEMKAIFDNEQPFDNPKPTRLIKRMVEISCNQREDNIILDFFAGSGTIAHAVLNLNKQDDGNRKFILVQLPEPTEREDYPTISDITKERVRRVIKKLNDEDAGNLDLTGAAKQDRGFRVFKLSESNFKTWKADAPHDAPALERQLELHIDHIRDDRSANDLLYEILLKSGFPITTTVGKLIFPPPQPSPAGGGSETPPPSGGRLGGGDSECAKTVYSVAGGALLICLEHELTLELIRAMAETQPERVVCLDEGFVGNDQLKANAVQIFKTKGITSFKTV